MSSPPLPREFKKPHSFSFPSNALRKVLPVVDSVFGTGSTTDAVGPCRQPQPVMDSRARSRMMSLRHSDRPCLSTLEAKEADVRV
ncbi:hypothetical protein BCR33DRAFT_716755 [Rhizoclosmatium globosum]|uniref:Uncharacterized protein n=1 Tax=Rhizoclosmatium globosum TaxID=329046 RepID=A0A1Y2CCP2_9FUNG|nr:hypothetical protein BCR33DRAFT_716755 [Rhizoclosmatium globosum]|eukprot:ORY44808.1 hypothetical protein BCR33DRAFT_716755 [Rhizoclosmatium globosum]